MMICGKMNRRGCDWVSEDNEEVGEEGPSNGWSMVVDKQSHVVTDLLYYLS